MMLALKPLADLVEVAELFNVTPRTIRGWIARERFPRPMRVGPGRLLRWRRETIDKYLTAQERVAAGKS